MTTKGNGVINLTGWTVIVPVWLYKQWIICCGFFFFTFIKHLLCAKPVCWFWGCFSKVGGHRPLIFSQREYSSVQKLSCVWLFETCSTPGLPVHHQLPKLAQTRVHQVSDAIQPSPPLSSPSPPVFNLSQHQGLSQGVSSWHQVARVLEFQLQHQSFQWVFSTGFL